MKQTYSPIHILSFLIFFSITIKAGNTQLQTLSGQTIQTEQIDTFLYQQMQNHNIPGLSIAIINDANIVYHKTMGLADIENQKAVNSQTVFEAASLSKPLFAFFVMGFVEQGKLDLDKPLYKYLPYPDIETDLRYKNITARMVLSHTSGFPNWRTDFPTNELFIKFNPGTGFEYSGEGYQYLAQVLAHIENTDSFGLEALFKKTVTQPLGMTHTQFMQSNEVLNRRATPYKKGKALNWVKANKNFGAAYSVHSEALDYSKWIMAILNQQLLSAESYEIYFSPQNVPIPDDHPSRAFGLIDWALGFSFFKVPDDFYIHGGNNSGFTSLVGLDRKQKWAVVLFTNADQATQFQIELFTFLNQ